MTPVAVRVVAQETQCERWHDLEHRQARFQGAEPLLRAESERRRAGLGMAAPRGKLAKVSINSAACPLRASDFLAHSSIWWSNA
jgi:hypothetical protein